MNSDHAVQRVVQGYVSAEEVAYHAASQHINTLLGQLREAGQAYVEAKADAIRAMLMERYPQHVITVTPALIPNGMGWDMNTDVSLMTCSNEERAAIIKEIADYVRHIEDYSSQG